MKAQSVSSMMHPIVRAYADAWNAHDPEAFRATFTPTGKIVDPSYPAGVTGAGIQEALEHGLKLLPDLRMDVGMVLESPGHIVFEWTITGLAQPAGKPVPVRVVGCDVLWVENGKIAELHGYFDRAGIAEQLSAKAMHAAD